MANAQDPIPDRAISPKHCVACPIASASGGCFGRLWVSEEKGLKMKIAISKTFLKNSSFKENIAHYLQNYQCIYNS